MDTRNIGKEVILSDGLEILIAEIQPVDDTNRDGARICCMTLLHLSYCQSIHVRFLPHIISTSLRGRNKKVDDDAGEWQRCECDQHMLETNTDYLMGKWVGLTCVIDLCLLCNEERA